MKTLIKLVALFTFLFANSQLNAQTVYFEYDQAGNRISGKTILMARAEVAEEEEEATTGFTEVIDEMTIKIYPNPTEGLIRVDFNNQPENELAKIILYDLSGKKITSKEGISGNAELDITTQPAGIYIMKIFVGNAQSEWKIIKK